MSIPNWSPEIPVWVEETIKILLGGDLGELSSVTLEKIVDRSEHFPIPFPIDTCRCKALEKIVGKNVLERNINSAYPIIHERALELCCKFILHKRRQGNSIERALYKNMNLKTFINRLLTKRAVTFMGRFDSYQLINGTAGCGNWETIGTTKQADHLGLEDCLSYDEIKLSAFLSISSYTFFANEGDRDNRGSLCTQRSKIEDEGIIIGLIGPRLSKEHFMEYQEIISSPEQNTIANGYGIRAQESVHTLFSSFYGEKCLTYEEFTKFKKTKSPQRFVDMKRDHYFDNHLYYKRLSISFDTLLLEANERAGVKNTVAYIHVVGLGLGVWNISRHQEKVFMDAFARRISCLGEYIPNVSDICFSYIKQEYCGAYRNGDIFYIKGHPRNGIKIHFSYRSPHQKLTGRDMGKLLVVSYAWDGNALPGNEFWHGMLGSTSDSATASSTQITEVHNPHINPLVCADNLMIVTTDGLLTFRQYRDLIVYENSTNKLHT